MMRVFRAGIYLDAQVDHSKLARMIVGRSRDGEDIVDYELKSDMFHYYVMIDVMMYFLSQLEYIYDYFVMIVHKTQ